MICSVVQNMLLQEVRMLKEKHYVVSKALLVRHGFGLNCSATANAYTLHSSLRCALRLASLLCLYWLLLGKGSQCCRFLCFILHTLTTSDCPIAPYSHNSTPLTASCIWLPRYWSLLLACADWRLSVAELTESPIWLPLYNLCMDLTESTISSYCGM
jgi:hypothetical protein